MIPHPESMAGRIAFALRRVRNLPRMAIQEFPRVRTVVIPRSQRELREKLEGKEMMTDESIAVSSSKKKTPIGPEHMVVLHSILDNLVVGIESNVQDNEEETAEASSSDWSSDDDDTLRGGYAGGDNNGSLGKASGGVGDSDLRKSAKKEEKKTRNGAAPADDENEASAILVKTKNEVVLKKFDDLFEFDIKDDDEFIPAGKILSSVLGSSVVVVQGNPAGETLVQGTVLCTAESDAGGSSTRRVIGSIDELFGPVNVPHYIIRNAGKDLCVKEGVPVVAIRRSMKTLDPALRIAMQQQKGSDASNLYDEEIEHEEFSDDEAERDHKRRLKRQQGGDKRKRAGLRDARTSRPCGRSSSHRGNREGGFDDTSRKRNRPQNMTTILSGTMSGAYSMSTRRPYAVYNNSYSSSTAPRFGGRGSASVSGAHDPCRRHPRSLYASNVYAQQQQQHHHHHHHHQQQYRHPHYTGSESYHHNYAAYHYRPPLHVAVPPMTSYGHAPHHAYPRGPRQYFSNRSAAAALPSAGGPRPGAGSAGAWVPPRFPPAPRSFAPSAATRGNERYPCGPNGSDGAPPDARFRR